MAALPPPPIGAGITASVLMTPPGRMTQGLAFQRLSHRPTSTARVSLARIRRQQLRQRFRAGPSSLSTWRTTAREWLALWSHRRGGCCMVGLVFDWFLSWCIVSIVNRKI